MAKISYASLKMKTEAENTTITFKNNDIEVLQYLGVEEKNTLINMAIQNAYEDHMINPILLDMFFHVYIIYLYTNISFTEKQKENPFKIYDVCKSNGLLNQILLAIPEEEYNELKIYLEEAVQTNEKYDYSLIGSIYRFLNELPLQAQETANILNNFNKEDFANVLEFAKQANGGREI